MIKPTSHPAWVYAFFLAIAMLLGWGLRGYIGGGPFGAMIPGVFVAMCIVIVLDYSFEAAAMAALFGAIGIGYGGNMTYGQTLGFLGDADTALWGLLGCVVKGGMWGLLGGAVLGVGLTHYQYDRKSLAIAFAIMVVAFFVGVKLINDPKLIYFSNRLDRPRDESWAGMLFAAVAFLVYLRNRGNEQHGHILHRFALWGALGGALGFGGGALWMVIGPHLPIPQKWIGWWKMMEFSFGFIFGAALGWCAYLHRDALYTAGQRDESPGESWGPVIGFAGFVVVIFGGAALLEGALPDGFVESGSAGAILVRNVAGILLSFIFFGAVAILLGLRSRHAAWHVAITLTFFHTVLDYTRDLSDPKQFGYTLPIAVQLSITIALTAVVGYLVYRLQNGAEPVRRLLLLAVWACYASACARSFLRADFFAPPEGQSAWSMFVDHHAELVFVHGTFTVSAIVATWFIVSYFRPPSVVR